MPNKFQYLYFKKILSVIKSCKNEVQLDNARKWFEKVVIANKLPSYFTPSIIKTYKAKKQQIQNGLAAKYN